MVLTIVIGLYGSPFAVDTSQSDVTIDPEYINGILTASSILFGMWAVVLGMKPFESEVYDKGTRKFLHKTAVRDTFFFCLFFLVADVLLIFLVSLGVFSQVITILFTALTFIFNVIFLTMTLYFYVFE